MIFFFFFLLADIFEEGLTHIPAFSTLIAEVNISGWSEVKPGDIDKRGKQSDLSPAIKGYGFKFVKIRQVVMTPHSLRDVFSKLPNGFEQACALAQQKVVDNESIRTIIQAQSPFFCIKNIDPNAYCSFDASAQANEIVISGWSGASTEEETQLVIPLQTAQRYTNMNSPDHISFLWDLAIRAGGLNIIATSTTHSKFTSASDSYLGAAFVNMTDLLSKVKFDVDADTADTRCTNERVMFDLGIKISCSEDTKTKEVEMDTVVVFVNTKPILGTNPQLPAPAAPDFCLVENDGSFYVEKAYLLEFAFKDKPHNIVFSCLYNATPLSCTDPAAGVMQQAARALYRRRVWGNNEDQRPAKMSRTKSGIGGA